MPECLDVTSFLVIVILLMGAPLMGLSLVNGLRTGMLEATGVPFATYTRINQPFLFWLASAVNGVLFIGSVALLVAVSFKGLELLALHEAKQLLVLFSPGG